MFKCCLNENGGQTQCNPHVEFDSDVFWYVEVPSPQKPENERECLKVKIVSTGHFDWQQLRQNPNFVHCKAIQSSYHNKTELFVFHFV